MSSDKEAQQQVSNIKVVIVPPEYTNDAKITLLDPFNGEAKLSDVTAKIRTHCEFTGYSFDPNDIYV